MNRDWYIDLALRGLRMPIGAHLVLNEQNDPEAIALDGRRLGQIIEATARLYQTPLAIPLMDLRLEKADLLRTLRIAEDAIERFHFDKCPEDAMVEAVRRSGDDSFGPPNQAHIDSIRYIADSTDLLPIGMAIGPFSLMTKLLADPITPIAVAGMGITAGEDPAVQTAEACLALAESAVHRSVKAQIRAGAKAIMICEPAANKTYISPKQVSNGSNVFEQFVMEPNLRLKSVIEEGGADLIFHDCGELTTAMVKAFGERLHPVILSLGSSRRLWEDAAAVPEDVVLFGNLPTKSFYSDSVLPIERVEQLTRDVIDNMRATGHPHILGSECDVLHVPDAAETIRRKVSIMLNAGRHLNVPPSAISRRV